MGDEQRLDRIEKMLDSLNNKLDNIYKLLIEDRVAIAKLESRADSTDIRITNLESHDKVHDKDLDMMKKQTWGIAGGLTILGIILQWFKS